MFRSLMTVIRKLYLYLTKVIFMLKHSVKLRRYINCVLMWQHAATSAYRLNKVVARFPCSYLVGYSAKLLP